ncbi:MAG: glycerol kinase GlpK [Fimbriimonadaceae bacterium]|nr:glycerol kinase GlpK [Alphaproteobacteria bacterium]
MTKNSYILALDQGTTSTRVVIYDSNLQQQSSAMQPLSQYFPKDGWVEHDAMEIFSSSTALIKKVLAEMAPEIPAAMGITNQRETCLIWSRQTGKPIHNAIVWQDRRTADYCDQLRRKGLEDDISERTGLLLDPYFSASKIAWLLDHVPGARATAQDGDLLCGTIDCWLIWKLTGGRVHASDATNASRTQLYNITDGEWDDKLLKLFDIPRKLLPSVHDCQDDYGVTDANIIGAEIPIRGVAGDQQAAMYGQACFEAGDIKATFGTGCFVLANTGGRIARSANRLLTTVGSQRDGARTYALEGSVFMAGATVQWLRDGLGIIADARESEQLARDADPASEVYLVPAFQGLGAPQWDADARGLICGMSRKTGRAEIVRAALEGTAWQTHDLMMAISADMMAAGLDAPTQLRVDGGMARNDWLLQFLADILDIPVVRSANIEATALGVASHAGLSAGLIAGEDALRKMWKPDATFRPKMSNEDRRRRRNNWNRAVARARSVSGDPDLKPEN